MNLTVTVEHRFDRAPDGMVWTWAPYPCTFWEDYLKVFDSVRVLARVREVSHAAPGARRADGPGVSVLSVPHYIGPWQYLRQARNVRSTIARAESDAQAVLLRAPSTLAAALYPALSRGGHPYAVEVLGDPYDCFSPGAIDHPLRPYFRWRFTRELRRQCEHACAVAYVTREALQRRYPAGTGALSAHFSDVELRGDIAKPKKGPATPGQFSIVTVGSLEQRYKGIDVLIDAVDVCLRAGHDVRLTVVGGGKYQPELERQAAKLDGRVRFTGRLSSDAVHAELKQSDLFVLPSKTEGLPRALVEAMAAGLPCIASAVGGIPELLPGDALVPPGDSRALAEAIGATLRSTDRMAEMAEGNVKTAHGYRKDILSAKRIEFCRHVRQRTMERLQTGQGDPRWATA